jgi:hypothetical protein
MARATTTRGIAAGLLAGVALAGAIGLQAQDGGGEQDGARAAWRYRRAVLPADATGEGGFVAIAIPPEVAERSQPGLQDLRLVGADGREVPYVLDADVPRATERRRGGRLVEAQRERRNLSAWTVDFGVEAAFDRLELEIDGADFSKRVSLETSPDGARWSRVEGDAWVFDRPWRGRQVHDTTLERPDALRARFVRLTIDDYRSPPVVVRSVTAVLTGTLGGRRWTRDAPLVRLETPAGQPSRYRIDAAPGLPIERVTVAADDAAFWRDARVFGEVRDAAPVAVSPVTPIYRVRLDDADLDAERRDIDLERPTVGSLILEIDDRDSPPLARPRVTLSGVERRLLMPAGSGPLTLYYGNPATRRPLYDLEALRSRLAFAPTFPAGTLGPEIVNPRYAALPPMAFLAARGAAAETSRWSVARTLTITGSDDLYTLTLAPQDLAYLRPDLADLRVVDGEGRQVPYVLEPRAVAARVRLTVAGATPRANAPRTSAWQLAVPAPGLDTPARTPLPLTDLDLLFAEAFFTRPAVLLEPDARAPHGQRPIAQTTLRTTRREAGAPRAPLTLALGDRRVVTLGLEIADGDNAPLRLETAEAVVWVPRVTFKAAAGSYRLLFGNPEAGAPTYDLDALRQDVLAYSAIPLDGPALKEAAANADYAPGAPIVVGRVVQRGPVLWTVLGVSIAGLIWLTWAILRRPPSPRPPAGG